MSLTVSHPLVRLVGRNTAGEGRVEVFHRGSWGTVCDDHWSEIDADIVCQELGFVQAISAPHFSTFGEGNGTVSNLPCVPFFIFLSSYTTPFHFLPVRYGWMMSSVMGVRRQSLTVPILAGALLTASIQKMPLQYALVLYTYCTYAQIEYSVDTYHVHACKKIAL